MGLLAILTFLGTVVFYSMSGVLMPGPVTAVTVSKGTESPHAGMWVAVGHGVLEFPLMALIYFGAGYLFQIESVKIGIGLIGGLVLLWMGIGMLKDYKNVGVEKEEEGEEENSITRSPFLAGIILSASNPYFLVWWATVGAVLISKSWEFGVIGFILFAIVHWLCDLIWFYFLSILSFIGGNFFGNRLQKGVFIVCGVALICFSGVFLFKAGADIIKMAG